MKLAEIMTRDIETIRPDATLQQPAEKKMSLGVGMLPIAEKGGVIGIITDRDITVRAVAKELDPKKSQTEITLFRNKKAKLI